MLLYPTSYDEVNPHRFSSLALAACQSSLNRWCCTALGLVEEEKVGASTEEYSCADDNAFEINEEEGSLHESEDDHDEGEDCVDHEHKPEEFYPNWAYIFFIGSTLKHEFFGSKLIILKEPPDSNQFLACDVLGEPKINDDY